MIAILMLTYIYKICNITCTVIDKIDWQIIFCRYDNNRITSFLKEFIFKSWFKNELSNDFFYLKPYYECQSILVHYCILETVKKLYKKKTQYNKSQLTKNLTMKI